MDIVMKYRDLQILFEYSGICEYVPNTANRSGYGSDEWFFLCRSGNQGAILRFEFSGDFGKAVWSCFPVPAEEYTEIERSGGKALRKAFCSLFSSGLPFCHLHPVDLDVVKSVIRPSFSRTGPLKDADYYGD